MLPSPPPQKKKKNPSRKQSDALISRIASKIAERFPKVEKVKEGEHAQEKATTKAKQAQEAAAAAATAAAAPAQAPKTKKKKPPPPPSAQKAAAPKRKEQQKPLSSQEKQQKQQQQQPTEKKSKVNAKARTKALNSSFVRPSRRPSLSLDDFAAAEAAVASGFAAKKRAKQAEATPVGSSAEV